MQPELGRGLVQRVWVAWIAGREVALFDVRVPGETLHLVCAGGLGAGVLDGESRAQLREAMRGGAISPSQAGWRSRFEGARAQASLRAVELAREGPDAPPADAPPRDARDEGSARARAREGREGPERRVVCVESHAGEALRVAEGGLADGDLADRAALEARGKAIVEALGRIGVDGRREGLRRALVKAIARVARRVAAVQGDLARTASADELALRAQLFVAVASSAPRGVDHLRAIDWTTGEAQDVELPIDPARSAKEQIEALFKRARRLKEGAKIGRARLAAAQSSETGLREALRELDEFDERVASAPDLDGIEARARAAAPRDFRPGQASASAVSTMATGAGRAGPSGRGRARGDTPHPPYRTFVGASGARILVGRGAAHNDALTHRVARPHDLWLHAKGQTGAHVVVALEKGASCPPDLLVEAAHLAAHFSGARDERIVDVTYTPRRYLRKPRGSPPGLVVVDREKVLVLRKDDELLRRLLEGEVV